MDPASPLADLVERCRQGDPEATAELFSLYAERLSRLADQHLGQRLASRLDEQDVLQSVFRTFFARAARGEFRIDSGNQLWRLLVRITLAKVRSQARYHTAERRDVGAECAADASGGLADRVSREPNPEDAAILVDEIEKLVRGLPELHSRVLELRLRGFSTAEIAREVGMARQTIHRALDLLKQRATEAESQADPAADPDAEPGAEPRQRAGN